MRILILEDKGLPAHYLIENLKEKGHLVHKANNVRKANHFLNTYKEEIDCIIADSNMDPAGLSIRLIKESKGGLLSGLLWLIYNVFVEYNELQKKTIIYSDYVSDIKQYINKNKDRIEGLNVNFENVLIVHKRESNSAKKVLNRINILSK